MGLVHVFGVVLFVLSQPAATALKFVVGPLGGGSSPALDLMAIAAELQSRGHAVAAVVSPGAMQFMKRAAARHSSNTTAEALTYISFPWDSDATDHRIAAMLDAASKPTSASKYAGVQVGVQLVIALDDIIAEACMIVLENAATAQQVRAFQPDVILSVGMPGIASVTGGQDSCGCMLAHALGAQFADVNSDRLLSAPYYVPQFASGLSPADLKTSSGYAKNVVMWALQRLFFNALSAFGPQPWVTARKQHNLPRRATGNAVGDGLSWLQGSTQQTCQPLVEVLLGNWLLEYPRPLQAHQVLVGPGTPRPARPISDPVVADFLDTAPAGVVLAAFGTTIQTRTMLTASEFVELAHAFAAVAPTRVLWALREQGVPAGITLASLPLGSNTKLAAWVDFNDALGHPQVKAFVSHAGLHPIYEAMFHGTPVVAMPFHGEQADHAAKMAAGGRAVVCRQAPAFRPGKPAGSPDTSYTREHVAGLIKEVLSNASYAEAARGVAETMQTYARRRQPYKRAADEVELAVNAWRTRRQQPPPQAGTTPSNQAPGSAPCSDCKQEL